MTLTLESFALKIVKKAEELAFSSKAKITNVYIPEKVKKYIEENLSKEVTHFRNKYKLEFNIMSDEKLSIPEYKIDLLNKNKKIIKKIENIESIEKIAPRYNHNKKFRNNKFNKNFKMRNKSRKKFKYHSRVQKNNFENKKIVNY